MRVFCDFDGTIAKLDVTDYVLSQLADPKWEVLEEGWLAGRMTAAACMRAQVELIGGSDADLDAVLDAVELDDGFADFVAWCRRRQLDLTIVSDGVDYFIRRVLKRHGLDGLSVVSNRLAGREMRRHLEQPWARAGCAAGSGVCKCEVLRPSGATPAGPAVFIGDGRSDFCASARADILFAKSKLAEYAAARGQAFHPFSDFHDVLAQLAGMAGGIGAVAV